MQAFSIVIFFMLLEISCASYYKQSDAAFSENLLMWFWHKILKYENGFGSIDMIKQEILFVMYFVVIENYMVDMALMRFKSSRGSIAGALEKSDRKDILETTKLEIFVHELIFYL